jgi:hypothetical protein
LPERLEQHIFIEGEKEGMILVKLLAHGPFQKLNLAISELIERRTDCDIDVSQADGTRRLGPCERSDGRTGSGF